ncbi:MAG: DUF1573 domain-containing protein [Candidatus Omnitrophica bacterium]|nr:DUF1573 domain-containing protein [Candidatus Omnitrophota bacterium]
MRFFSVIFSSILILSSFSVGCLAQTSQNQGKSQDRHSSEDAFLWDFGKMKEGETAKHEFILKNETGKILNIKEVNTSCGCTVSSVQKKQLAPGESTVIDVSFNSKGYSGLITQYIYVNTDNINEPVIRFMIKAEVIK